MRDEKCPLVKFRGRRRRGSRARVAGAIPRIGPTPGPLSAFIVSFFRHPSPSLFLLQLIRLWLRIGRRTLHGFRLFR